MSLGSIVVRLTMNTADFETDAGRAAKIAERRAKDIDAAFKKAGLAIGAALGAAVVGVTAAIKQSIDRMDELYNAAKKVQMPTEEFSALAYAAAQSDVGVDQLVATMGKLTKSQAAAIDTTSEQAAVFNALRIDAIDPVTGAMRSASDVLLDFADRFKEMKGSPEAMAAGFVLFGRSFQDMIPLLEQGRGGIEDLTAQARAAGVTFDDEAGAAADQFNDNLQALQQVAVGLATQLAQRLLPDLVSVSGGFLDTATQGERVKEVADDIADVFGTLGTAAHIVSSAFEVVGAGLATIAAQGVGAYKVLTGLLTLDLSKIADGKRLYAEASAGLDSEVAEAFGRTPRATGPKPSFAGVVAKFGDPLQGKALEEVQFKMAVEEAKRQKDYAERLRKALGAPTGAPKGGGSRTKKAELTEEQKAAEQLQKAYEGLTGSMAERIALFGEETELAKLNYEIQSGSLKGLGEAEQAKLRQQAIELDNLQLQEEGRRILEGSLEPFERINAERARATELLEAGAIAQDEYNRVIRDLRTPAEEMLEDMQFELELLGKTREEQELLTAARYLGAEAATAQGQAALAAMELQQQAAKGTEDQVAAMDGLRDSARGFLDDLKAGVGVWDALKNAADSFADTLFRIVANNLVEQMFGQQGSSGGGSGGGWFASLLGAFFGAGSGGTSASSAGWGDIMQGNWGFSSGGYTGPGGVNQPAGLVHRGEVVWSQGDIARAGGVGAVESMRRGGGAGRFQQTVNVTVAGRPDRRTPDQIARAAGREARREMARTGG